jgi:plasmid maintenance system antidote protein VapI
LIGGKTINVNGLYKGKPEIACSNIKRDYKRKMTPEVAFRIDNELGMEESTMAILQARYDTTG